MRARKEYLPITNWEQKYYFVELDVKFAGEEELYRTSNFVRLSPKGVICLMDDHMLKKDAKIYILTVVRDQYVWVKYMIEMLENIVTKTNEANVSLLYFTTFNSRDNFFLNANFSCIERPNFVTQNIL